MTYQNTDSSRVLWYWTPPNSFLGVIYLGSTIWFEKSWITPEKSEYSFERSEPAYLVQLNSMPWGQNLFILIWKDIHLSICIDLFQFLLNWRSFFRYLFFPYFICRLFIVSWVIYTLFFKSIENSPIFFVSKHIMFPRQLNTALKLGSAGCFFFDICLFELNFSWTLNAS